MGSRPLRERKTVNYNEAAHEASVFDFNGSDSGSDAEPGKGGLLKFVRKGFTSGLHLCSDYSSDKENEEHSASDDDDDFQQPSRPAKRRSLAQAASEGDSDRCSSGHSVEEGDDGDDEAEEDIDPEAHQAQVFASKSPSPAESPESAEDEPVDEPAAASESAFEEAGSESEEAASDEAASEEEEEGEDNFEPQRGRAKQAQLGKVNPQRAPVRQQPRRAAAAKVFKDVSESEEEGSADSSDEDAKAMAAAKKASIQDLKARKAAAAASKAAKARAAAPQRALRACAPISLAEPSSDVAESESEAAAESGVESAAESGSDEAEGPAEGNGPDGSAEGQSSEEAGNADDDDEEAKEKPNSRKGPQRPRRNCTLEPAKKAVDLEAFRLGAKRKAQAPKQTKGNKKPLAAAAKKRKQVVESESEEAASEAEPEPFDAENVEKILDGRPAPDGSSEEYFVKYKGHSYRAARWIPAQPLWDGRAQLLRNFIQKRADGGLDTSGELTNGVHPDWLLVDRVIAHRMIRDGSVQYLTKWRGLSYSESTWEAEKDLKHDKAHLQRYEERQKPPSRARPAAVPNDALPEFQNGRNLRDYQRVSLEWMTNNRNSQRNCILGDEMGLGKTAQSIAVLEFQSQLCNIRGPFLVIAPLTTLGHWQREIETWTNMNVVQYSGSAADRQLIQTYEFRYLGDKAAAPRKKFNVLLTSYEYVLKDRAVFESITWATVIIDEAHRMKSTTAATRQVIDRMDITWLLLLTGTPVQNNIRELWGIMSLLDQAKYGAEEDFYERFGGDREAPTIQQIHALQAELKPILLRRMKEDVETLPEKEEVIVWVELTQQQRAYYRALYSKQIASLLGGASAKNLPNMRNLAMELRKVCCHPYLCNGLEDDIALRRQAAGESGMSELDLLVQASGKMVLLHKLLPKLKAEGHKVLIFSQFKIMLDVLEDMLRLSNFPVERIDGSVASRDRQTAIDRFSKGKADSFVFLLSTRAGGQGITLTAADTVIIYDSDWNPQNDLQAMARCHRIGQVKEVTIYRLVSRDTYEQQVFQCSSRKYGLDEAILGNISSEDPEADSKKIAELLKYGAHSLNAEDEAKGDEQFASEDIDQILAGRTEKRQIGSRAGNTFSVATFAAEEPKVRAPSDEREYWAAVLPDAVAAYDKQLKAPQVLAPRQRRAMNYNEAKLLRALDEQRETGDQDFEGEGGRDSSSDDDLELEGPPKVGAVRLCNLQCEQRETGDQDFEGEGDSSSDDDDLELEGPPKRRGRGKAGDKAEPKGKLWTKPELKSLEDRLIALGAGRSAEVCEQASLSALRNLEEVVEVEAALLKLIQRAAAISDAKQAIKDKAEQAAIAAMLRQNLPGVDIAATSSGRAPTATAVHGAAAGDAPKAAAAAAQAGDAAAEGGQAMVSADDPLITPDIALPPLAQKVMSSEETTSRLVKNGAKYAALLAERATLARLVEGLEAGSSAATQQLYLVCQIPIKHNMQKPGGLPHWWSKADDKALLLSSHKLGHNPRNSNDRRRMIEATLADPDLGIAAKFARVAGDAPGPAGSPQTAAEGAEAAGGPATAVGAMGELGEADGAAGAEAAAPAVVGEGGEIEVFTADGLPRYGPEQFKQLVDGAGRRLRALMKLLTDPEALATAEGEHAIAEARRKVYQAARKEIAAAAAAKAAKKLKPKKVLSTAQMVAQFQTQEQRQALLTAEPSDGDFQSANPTHGQEQAPANGLPSEPAAADAEPDPISSAESDDVVIVDDGKAAARPGTPSAARAAARSAGRARGQTPQVKGSASGAKSGKRAATPAAQRADSATNSRKRAATPTQLRAEARAASKGKAPAAADVVTSGKAGASGTAVEGPAQAKLLERFVPAIDSDKPATGDKSVAPGAAENPAAPTANPKHGGLPSGAKPKKAKAVAGAKRKGLADPKDGFRQTTLSFVKKPKPVSPPTTAGDAAGPSSAA
ncbi:hypothetical protein WJX72_008847 [[Myrmecia] bisecta]|uniref:Uncharacterized protein n=1 Tax=[Myrmecia] bisecta TaxID=41462 RepID=A0AAW1Q0G5_9CHLO